MRALLFLALVAACDDSKPATAYLDAPASPFDAADTDAPDLDGPPANPCDYTEAHDATNDTTGAGTAEASGLTFQTRSVLCSEFESDHFDGDITVDIDAYRIHVAQASTVTLRLSGAGLDAIEFVGMDIYDGAQFDHLAGTNTFYGDHAVTEIPLPAGDYELLPFALNSAAIPATLAYRITMTVETRGCTDGGSYAEAHDGAANTGNDMVTIPDGSPIALTASTADAPEPSGLTIAPDRSIGLSGNLADVMVVDKYEDKDTFEIATGPMTNELDVQLAWTGASNLDFYLFEAGSPDAIVRAIDTAATEHRKFSVKPSTTYWLTTGVRAGTTVPVNYAIDACGIAFNP